MGSSSLIKNTAIYAIGDIFPKIFALITFPVLTNLLLPEEYGIINYVNTIDTFLMIFGLLSVNTYYLVYYYRMESDEERRKLLGNLSIFLTAFNTLFTIILFIVGKPLLEIWGSDVSFYPYVALGLVTNFFNVQTILPTALFRLQERPLPLTVLNVIKGLATMIMTLWAVYYWKSDAIGVLFSRMTTTVVFGLIFIFITFKNALFRFNYKQIKEALYFSLPLVPGSIAYSLYSLFDRVLIEKYLTLSDLGIYSTATTLALLLNIVSYGAYKAFEPYFFKSYGHPQFESKFKKVRDSLLYVVLVGGICLSVYSKEFFEIFSSKEYSTAYLYVPIIVLGAIASSISNMYTTILTAMGKTKTSAIITIVGALISISLNALLLKIFGIWTAAIVFALSFMIVMWATKWYTKIKVSSLRAYVATIFASLYMFSILYTMPISSLTYSITIKSILNLVVFAIMLKILQINPFKLKSL